MNKCIVFTEKDRAELVEEPIKEPEEFEVSVKLEYSAISAGTERANLTGEANVSAGNCLTEAVFPRKVGYSTSGTVVAVGSGVTKVKIGDRVIACWGHHKVINTVHENNVYKIPEGVSSSDAAFALISTFPMAAIRKCRLELGESAMVMGLGILGMFAIKLLRIAGAYPIIAVDPVADKREQAIKYGADYAFDPTEPDFGQKVKKVTNGGVNVCIEVTGLGAGLINALDGMARYGRVALLGCTRHSDFSIDYYNTIHAKGLTFIGAHTMARPRNDSSGGWWTEADDLKTYLGLLQGGRLDVSDLGTQYYSPTEATEVYNRLITDKKFPTVQFDWRDME
jgi:threonine dehydrogenase-like Zn-dependent dehydrogenase